jgi:hypothetical protein
MLESASTGTGHATRRHRAEIVTLVSVSWYGGGMEPEHLLLLGAGVVVLLVLWRLLSRRHRRPSLPYTRRRSLLTAGELRFYSVLLRAVPSGLAVFVKVRLMDVVSVPDHAWPTYGAPGSGMHLDFVLADTTTIEPLLVIELDDRSHAQPEARQRDAFKNDALASAGVPIVRVVVTGWYEVADLRARIRTALASA